MIRVKALKQKTANKIKVWHSKVYNGVTNLLIVKIITLGLKQYCEIMTIQG